MRKTLYYLLIAIAVSVNASTNKHQVFNQTVLFQNPIINSYLADPYIFLENGYYYFFATGEAKDKRFIPIYRSRDLSKWEFVRGAVTNGSKTDWNYKHFWAPEVLKINGKYYLYYTATPDESPANSGNRVGVAIADSIQGPYKNIGVVIPNGSIDGHPVIDKDGTMYIFYTNEWQSSKGFYRGTIYMDKMLSPTQVADNPKPIITHHNWQEGPFILQRNNQYYLTYSCGAWSDSTYHLRYAIANSITGPYIEQPDSILKSNKMVKGPGHHSIFMDKYGQDWVVYHGWDTAHSARYPRIDRLFVNGIKLKINGPTYTRQKVKNKVSKSSRTHIDENRMTNHNTLAIKSFNYKNQPIKGVLSQWNGHKRYDFKFLGRDAIIVEPNNPAKGKPWIVRPAFFDAFAYADSALVEKGFYVCYFDVTHFYGSLPAQNLFSNFYDFVVNNYGLSPKATLEGFSRGGFFTLNWAANNPKKVACIYVDAPVCNINSWPRNKDNERWAEFLNTYNITESQADSIKCSPIDFATELAQSGIPILSVCGDADVTVPFSENTLLLSERMQKAGGKMEIIIKKGVDHHPHSLSDSTPIVDFILKHQK